MFYCPFCVNIFISASSLTSVWCVPTFRKIIPILINNIMTTSYLFASFQQSVTDTEQTKSETCCVFSHAVGIPYIHKTGLLRIYCTLYCTLHAFVYESGEFLQQRAWCQNCKLTGPHHQSSSSVYIVYLMIKEYHMSMYCDSCIVIWL